MEKKQCKKCKKIRPLLEFYKRSDDHGDGYFTWCFECERKKYKEKYHRNRVRESLRQKKKTRKNKIIAIEKYGNKCNCCKEKELSFLVIDHINENGGKHRKELKGKSIYVWLRLNNYPEGYQVLCYNCNWAKTRLGRCPHKDEYADISNNS